MKVLSPLSLVPGRSPQGGPRTKDHRPGTTAALAVLFFLLSLGAAAQEPFGTTDPFESRFKTKTNFQIRFKAPEKGGEVRLYTRDPVHYEKDVSWEGAGEVVIDYQDVHITADKGHYDFPSKTATLEGHVVIDQGPTRLAGSRASFPPSRARRSILSNTDRSRLMVPFAVPVAWRLTT